jgi:putative transposase
MKITKEDLLNSEFLKQFKDSGELDGFLSELHKRGIEKMLEGELDSHLGYERYSPEGKNTGNSRNGKTEKKIKTGFGESQIEVPRDRDGSFEPAIVPKRKGLAKGIEDLVISLYAKGMGNSDIEEQIREIYDFSTINIHDIQYHKQNTSRHLRMAKQAIGPGLPYRMDGWDRIQGTSERKSDQ